MRFYHNLIQLALALVGSVTLSCSENVIETDMREENYVHNFINKFGLPDSDHDWSMAKSNTFTVETKNCLNVALMARIGNEEYLFADLGAVSGRTQFIANLPTKVDRLFIRVNGEEDYDVQPGKTFNIDAARSSASRAEDQSTTEELGMTVTVTDRTPSISILGRVFNSFMDGFEPGNNYLDFQATSTTDPLTVGDFQTNIVLKRLNPSGTDSGAFYETSHINFYPIFTRPNKYNEDDYVIGVYVRNGDGGPITHYDLCRPGEMNASSTNRWIEDADGVRTTFAGDKWFKDSDLGLNANQITKGGNFLTLNGKSIDLSGFKEGQTPGDAGHLGFYIKSGIKNFNDKIAPHHCKYTHI